MTKEEIKRLAKLFCDQQDYVDFNGCISANYKSPRGDSGINLKSILEEFGEMVSERVKENGL